MAFCRSAKLERNPQPASHGGELVSFWPDYMGYGEVFAVEDLEPLLEKRGLHRLPSWIEWCKAFGYAPSGARLPEENAGPADPVPARA